MKSNKAINKLTILLIVLIIILLACISFFGILQKNLNKWEDIIPEYLFSKELSGTRMLNFKIDDSTKEVEIPTTEENAETPADDSVEVNETVNENESIDVTPEDETQDTEENTEEEPKTQTVPVNDPANLTKENYKKAKEIIEKRFSLAGITDYEIRLNENSGEISIEVPYDSTANKAVQLVVSSGKVEIVDDSTNELLMDNSYIENVTAYYDYSNTTDTTTVTDDNTTTIDIGVRLNFTKDGLKKLNEISKTYIETINESGETSQKAIAIKIDDEVVYRTYFSLDTNYNSINVPLYRGVSDTETINDDFDDVNNIQYVINSGKLPVSYVGTTGSYVQSDFINTNLKYIVIGFAIVVAIGAIILIIKFKLKGFFGALLEIGYIAILLLAIRYASVIISITGMGTILLVSILNYIFTYMMLKNNTKSAYVQTIKKFYLTIIPLVIMAIVFTFASSIQVNSIGMILFWGLIITLLYNLVFSKILFDNYEKIGVNK